MKNTAERLTLTKKLALTGAFSALIIVLGITRLGFISIGAASITILHIPVILTVLLAGLPAGVFAGAVFGILSLIMASMTPSGVLDPLFVNPLCSVLPRVLFAVAAWGLWKLFNLIPKMPKIASAGISACLATIIHTLLVLGSLYLFQGESVKNALGGMGYMALVGACGLNIVLESASSTIISAAVFTSLFITSNSKSKLSKEAED